MADDTCKDLERINHLGNNSLILPGNLYPQGFYLPIIERDLGSYQTHLAELSGRDQKAMVESQNGDKLNWFQQICSWFSGNVPQVITESEESPLDTQIYSLLVRTGNILVAQAQTLYQLNQSLPKLLGTYGALIEEKSSLELSVAKARTEFEQDSHDYQTDSNNLSNLMDYSNLTNDRKDQLKSAFTDITLDNLVVRTGLIGLMQKYLLPRSITLRQRESDLNIIQSNLSSVQRRVSSLKEYAEATFAIYYPLRENIGQLFGYFKELELAGTHGLQSINAQELIEQANQLCENTAETLGELQDRVRHVLEVNRAYAELTAGEKK